ncbi:hypothetical protein BH23GEM11_BH23GEM11_11380 [soil metagenome]
MIWRATVAVGDPLRLSGDALARPVTSSLEGITPWSRQVEVEGGEDLRARLAGQDGLPAGAVLVTPGGTLPFELLLHAVLLAPDEAVGPSGLLRALRNVLRQAIEWDVGVLVLPLMGAGPGQLSLEEATEVMADALAELPLGPHPDDGVEAHDISLELRIAAAGDHEARIVVEILERGLPGRGIVLEGPRP